MLHSWCQNEGRRRTESQETGPHRQQKKKKNKKSKKHKKDKKRVAVSESKPKQYRWDVEYERIRSSCCSSKKSCCRPPANMYRADVSGPDDQTWVVIARDVDMSVPYSTGARGLANFDAHELEMLQRIQARQRLLHQLLLTHDSPLYDDDLHLATATDAHIVAFHEPAAATRPVRVEGFGPDGDLTYDEFRELQRWLSELPVVPHLSVVEVDANSHAASGDAFLEVAPPKMVEAKVLKGFVDVEQAPHTLADLLAALPPTPAVAADM